MNVKRFPLFLAVATLLVAGGQAYARHVLHPVTPKNIEKQPFSFTVNVKDVGQLKEFEIRVAPKAGRRPVASATGELHVAVASKRVMPTVTRVAADGVLTFTFRVTPEELDRAQFLFTETPQDVRTPFPFPGDYWGFLLKDFVGRP
jgi:hypothetical protein